MRYGSSKRLDHWSVPMQELTLSEVLAKAFVHARDLDAPLSMRLQTFADSLRVASPEFSETVDRLVQRLEQNGTGATAPKVGDVLPPFILPDEKGRLVALESVLEKGPAAISFHRGHWCPYCRINTAALAKAQCVVEPLGGQILAITPELRRFSVSLPDGKSNGYFPILSDVDNGYAMSLDLAIYIGQEMKVAMLQAGIDLDSYQGNDAWILPIPATFIVGRDGRIVSRFIDPDFRRRMAIEDIVDALKRAS